jgi:hypothetical protein
MLILIKHFRICGFDHYSGKVPYDKNILTHIHLVSSIDSYISFKTLRLMSLQWQSAPIMKDQAIDICFLGNVASNRIFLTFS